MITATSKPNATENNNDNEFLQARNKLKKVSSNGLPSAKEESTAAAVEAAPQPLQENSTNQTHSNDAQQERTLAIITLNNDLDAITQHIKNHGFNVLKTKPFQLSLDQVKEFYQNHQQETYYDKYTTWLSSSTLYALVLERENAIKEWKALMGPGQYKKARKIHPDSIRAKFAKDGSQSATHGSDSEASANKEIEFIFSSAVRSAETQDTVVETSHVNYHVQKNDSVSEAQLEEMTRSNTKDGATIHHDETPALTAPDTVSSVVEKANNASTPSTDITSNNDATDQEKKQKTAVEPEISIAPASADDKSNGIKIAEKDQSVIDKTVDNTSKSEAKPVDTNKDDDKTVDKNVSIDEIKDKKPNDHQQVEEEGAIAVVAAKGTAAVETVATVATETVASSKAAVTAATTTVVSSILTTNTKKEENHDKTDSSDIQTNPSENNTGVTSDNKTQNDLVTEDNKSSVAENSSPAPQSKEKQQCNSVTIDEEEEKSIDTPTIKEKDDCQAQNEVKQSQEVSGEKNETLPAPKNERDSSEKSEKRLASSEQVETIQTHEDKEGKKAIIEAKEKVRSPQTTPTISPKNKLSAKSIKEANNVKGDTVRPSTSRIRPPSIKRGQSGTMISSPNSTTPGTKQLLGPERRLRTTSTSGAKASTNGHTSAGATRIARLSSASSTNSSSSSDQEKRPSVAANSQAKKPLTKVSKHLPRVVTIATTQKPLPSTQYNAKKESTDEKPKKRVSSTKSFISRLTAPTVASANKKSEHHETATQQSSAGVVRRTTLTKKQGAVKPNNSTGASKKKKEDTVDTSAATDKVSTENK